MILISLSVIYKTFLNTRHTDKHATFPLMQKVLIVWTKASISWPVLHIQAPGGKHRNHGPHCWDTPSTTCTDSSGLQDRTRQPQWTASLRRREDTSGQAPISKCLASSLDLAWSLQMQAGYCKRWQNAISLQQLSVPHAGLQRLLQALVSLLNTVTPGLFRFIRKFPTY